MQKALIGWKKAGAPKKPLLIWSCRLLVYLYYLQLQFILEKNYCNCSASAAF